MSAAQPDNLYISKSYGIDDLISLVNNNQYEEIACLLKDLEETNNLSKLTSNDSVPKALRDAVLLGHIEIVRLFSKCPLFNSFVFVSDNDKRYLPLIYFAVMTNQLDMVKLLVENGATIKEPNLGEDYNSSHCALKTAVKLGYTEIVKYLLENGANANGYFSANKFHYHHSYLTHAVKHGRGEIASALASHMRPEEIASNITDFAKAYTNNIRKSKKRLKDDFSPNNRNKLLSKLQDPNNSLKEYYQNQLLKFDQKKASIEEQIRKSSSDYERIMPMLLDYAMGCDFKSQVIHRLKSIAGLNLIGVSIDGKPITRENLLKAKIPGADQAIITIYDLWKIKDPERKARLINQLKNAFKILGEYIENGIVNLVPIDAATANGDSIAVKTRLNAGANPNHHNRHCLIVLAARNNQSHIVDLLREHPDFDKSNLPAAIEAAKTANHLELAEKLLMQDVNALDENGFTLLGQAVVRGNIDEVKKLISKGANVNLSGKDNYPLCLAAKHCYDKQYFGKASKNHIEILKILLENHADPNLAKNNGPTAMCIAGKQGSVEALKLLIPVTLKNPVIEHIKETSVSFPWYTQIMFESYPSKEWLDILRLLKSEGADLKQLSTSGESLLHLAIRGFSGTYSSHISNSFDLSVKSKIKKKANDIHHDYDSFVKYLKYVEFLLAEGVNPNIKSNYQGNTALHDLISYFGLETAPGMYAKIIDPCLQHGFDINAKNECGETLLHLAASDGRLNAVKYLIARGADINAVSNCGNTPLHFAMAQREYPYTVHPEVTDYLLAHGAIPTLQNKFNLTPLQRMEKLICEEMKTGSFKLWSDKAKQECHQAFNQCKEISLNYSIPMEDVQFEVDALSQSMQNYIKQFTHSDSNEKILASLSIPEKDRFILAYYTDTFSNRVMNIPVLLNERLYDLNTLLSLPANDRRDPVTHAIFKLSDIKPAEKIAKELAIILLDLQNKFQDKNNEYTQGTKPFLLFSNTSQPSSTSLANVIDLKHK